MGREVNEGGGRLRSRPPPSYFEPYIQAVIGPALVDEQDTDKLPFTVVGTFVDTDDSHLPGAGAGPNGKPCGGAVRYVF